MEYNTVQPPQTRSLIRAKINSHPHEQSQHSSEGIVKQKCPTKIIQCRNILVLTSGRPRSNKVRTETGRNPQELCRENKVHDSTSGQGCSEADPSAVMAL